MQLEQANKQIQKLVAENDALKRENKKLVAKNESQKKDNKKLVVENDAQKKQIQKLVAEVDALFGISAPFKYYLTATDSTLFRQTLPTVV